MPDNQILQERKEMDARYQWDLTPMYQDDAAWRRNWPRWMTR